MKLSINTIPHSLSRSSVAWSLCAAMCTLAFTVSVIASMPRSDAHRSASDVLKPVSFVQDEGQDQNQDPNQDQDQGQSMDSAVTDDVPSPEELGDVATGAGTDSDSDFDQGSDITESRFTAPLYAARVVQPVEGGFAELGDLDDPNYRASLEFTPLGAGIESLQLPDEFETVKGEIHVSLQRAVENASGVKAVPFAALYIQINDYVVYLTGTSDQPIWSQTSPGVFEAFIDDADGQPVLRIQRSFTLKPNTQHGFILDETIENLSLESLRVQLVTTGPIDMPKAKSSYAGDRRRVRYGYLLPVELQGTSLAVTVDNELKSRNKLFGKKVPTTYGKAYPDVLTVWPNETILEGADRLSWLALTDRYFVVALHPHFDPSAVLTPEDKLLTGITLIDRLVLDPYVSPLDGVEVMRLAGEERELTSGSLYTRSLGIYAGPRNRPVMNSEPEILALNMPDMVVSNLGGICAPCTFSWLTDILIGVLRTFHSIVGDWAVSILLLVVVVRGCLHPVTRWSQIRVQRFSVQMQAMAPKQKAIREKYKDDSKRQQQEMSKLWREEGISPAGMLGCLPMFLQSPVWIALYATLFFASELRHEAAFYGIFQQFGGWGFMSDLAAPDQAIPLPSFMHFSFPMWGNVNSVNVLPLLLGVVFYLHQKYLTPPTQATLTPEQESQQKMMKVMMVILFPVMMYAAPSGLALYFITNSTMGIIENKWIRAHMKKHGMLEIENIRATKKDKGPGFMQRMTEAAEAQKQLREKGPAQPNPASKYNRRNSK
jgi:YidC/Oxa1 family membrane protein insertase